MSRKLYVLGLVALSLIVGGCTLPSQRVAQEALSIGVEQNTKIITAYGQIVRQLIVDSQAAVVRKAVADGDQAAAVAAVEKTATLFDACGYLDVQGERARSTIRIAQSYIWEQQGVFNIVADEWKAAKQKVDDSSKTGAASKATTKPSK